MFGISPKSYRLVMDAFSRFEDVEEVIIFGSRAKGNYRNGSDIDLAIKGKNCSELTAIEMKGLLNEQLPIPYMVDIVCYNTLQHPNLKDHIDRVGKVMYASATIVQ